MYNKLFTKILDSSIWLEPDATRLVWLTFLAAMDQDGFVGFASAANVAHRARVSMEAAEDALSRLESDDLNSSDPEHGGRRVERVPGGWMVLNAEKYRDLVTRVVAREQTRERVRRHRERKRTSNGVKRKPNAPVTQSETDTEADPEKIKSVSSATTDVAKPADVVLAFPASGNPAIWHLRADLLAEWRGLYPGLDVDAECRKAWAWNDANTRKTAGGMKRFLVNWLNRANDRGGSPARQSGVKSDDTVAAAQRSLERRLAGRRS